MRRIFVLLAALTLALLTTVPVTAETPPRLTSQITDTTSALSSSTSTITTALNTLQRDHNVQLWVLFVHTTGTTSVTDYADEVAAVNSLGVNDALLVVALDDRTDAIWVSDGLPQITTDEIDGIISRGVEPRLAAGDFGGAVVSAATGLGDAAGSVVGPTAVPSPTRAATPAPTTGPAASGGGSTPGSSSGGGGVSILPLLLIVAIGVGIFLFVRSRNRGRAGGSAGAAPSGVAAPGAPVVPVNPQELARQANAALLEMDESIRDANQELGFVEAQYGSAEAAEFRTDLDTAAAELKAAFVLNQQLDDSTPEDAATRQRMLTEIIERCGHARTLGAQQAARVSALRDIERNAPDVLSKLPPQIETAEARLPGARAAMDHLNDFASTTWQSVAGNVAEAEKRIDVAKTSVEAGTTAFGAGDHGLAASYVRQAQGALAEAAALFDAIDRLTASLNEARDHLPAEIAAAAADVTSARTAVSDSYGSPPGSGYSGTSPATDLATNLAQAESLLAAAQAAAAAPKPDVLDAYQKATQANAMADSVVAGARAETDRVARRRLVAEAGLRSASMSVNRASDFITTRRGGVGSEARTRVAEAQRMLDLATSMVQNDPDGALDNARRAQQLGDTAYQQAQADFTQFDQPDPEPARPPIGNTEAGGGNVSVAGVILGEVLGGILSGGIGRGGGWGGTRWGSSPPGSFGGGGGGGGGFGRTIGGGWGGLGGRSRGGHW